MTPVRDSLTPDQSQGRISAFLRRPGPRGGDGLLALTLTVLGVWLSWAALDPRDGPVPVEVERGIFEPPPVETGPQIWTVLLCALGTVAVGWRRTRPITAFTVQLGAVLFADGDSANIAGIAALAMGAYSVAAHVARLPVAAGVCGAATLVLVMRFPGDEGGLPGFLVIAVMATMSVTGRTISTWRSRAGAFHRRALRAEHAREVAVAAERARIARELHDIVSHNVSVMVIQSGAARMVLRADPDAATEALRAVETAGRETMAELRQMLNLLTAQSRTDKHDPDVGPEGDALGPPLAPQPDLARLPVLLDRVRTAGLDVCLETRGAARPLPPGVELTVYRVVQEALTNALKYAPGSHTEVTLTYASDAMDIEVADSGPAEGRHPDPIGAGRGLLGLTERVTLHGGGFRSGHRPTGGYRVQASIPVPVV